MYVIVRSCEDGQCKDLNVYLSPTVSTVRDLYGEIRSPHKAKFYFSGKELIADHTLSEYGIVNLSVISLYLRNEEDEPSATGSQISDDSNVENSELVKIVTECSHYKVGDLVDVMLRKEQGAWFEAKIVKILIYPDRTAYSVEMDRNEKCAPFDVDFEELRPRARTRLNHSELEPGMHVLVNYNEAIEEELGYWYEFEITDVFDLSIRGTLFRGPLFPPKHDIHIIIGEMIFKLEPPTLVSERSDEIFQAPELRPIPPCSECQDAPVQFCEHCGCSVCKRKSNAHKMIICDDCDKRYHLFCLKPKLKHIPTEPDWFCNDCKNKPSEIIGPGQKLRVKKNNELARAGQLNYQLRLAANTVKVGTCWKNLSQMYEYGFDKNKDLILDREFVDMDDGYEIYYTPSFYSAQMQKSLKNYCAKRGLLDEFGIIDYWQKGAPFRVVRGSNMPLSKFAPKSGYRYDGIYKIVEYFPTADPKGNMVRRYCLRRYDWTRCPWKGKNTGFRIPKHIVEMMGEDKANKTKWEECKQVQDIEAFISKLDDTFKCLICCQCLVEVAVTTQCQHNFCKLCLQNWIIKAENRVCPICRASLADVQVNSLINRPLRRVLEEIKQHFCLEDQSGPLF